MSNGKLKVSVTAGGFTFYENEKIIRRNPGEVFECSQDFYLQNVNKLKIIQGDLISDDKLEQNETKTTDKSSKSKSN